MTYPKTVHGLFCTVRDAMKAKGVPYDFVYGTPRVPLAAGATRMTMEEERGVGETIKPPSAVHANPRMYARRGIPILVRIRAQSSIAGAEQHNHEELARLISQQVIVEMSKATTSFGTDYAITYSGLVADADKPEGWSGVVHELRFTVDDAVSDVAWTGEAATEVSPTIVTTHSVNGGTAPDVPSATTRIDP